MTERWLTILKAYGWTTPWKELTYMTTAEDDEYLKPVTIEKNIIKKASRKDGFKVLGTFFTGNNRQDR